MQSEPLRFRDIFLFQIGSADAIRRVVVSRWSLVIGLLFVFTAAIARNYDQTFLLWHSEKFAGPFIAAFVSSILVFLAIWWSGTRDREDDSQPGFFRQFPGFLAAFLMTAPLAWFYAIPVEAMTDSLLTAAKWNVLFLSLVSLWRVWLITRVAQVITGAPFLRLLFPILIPASAEAFVGSNFAGFTLAGAMGGILPPDKEFTLRALRIILNGSAIVFWASVVACIAVAFIQLRVGWKSTFSGTWETKPKKTLLLIALIALGWVAIAVPRQMEIWNQVQISNLVSQDNYDDAIEFLRDKQRSDFPPGRAFYPNHRYPYAEKIAEILLRLGPETPEWIIDEYIEAAGDDIRRTLTMIKAHDREETDRVIEALAKYPQGRELLRSIAEDVMHGGRNGSPSMQPDDLELLMNELRKAGVEFPDEWRPVPITPPPLPGAEADDTGTSPAN